jgi:hypothetical protein
VLSYMLLLQPRCWSGAPSAAVKSQGSCMKACICKTQSGVIIMVHWSEEFVVALPGFLFSRILRSNWCMQCMRIQTACVASSTQATTAVAAPLPSPIISPPHLRLNRVSCSNCGNPSSEVLARHCAINRVRSCIAAMAAPVRIEHVGPVPPAKTRGCEGGGGGGEGGRGGGAKMGGSGTSLLGTPSSTMSCRSTSDSDRGRS